MLGSLARWLRLFGFDAEYPEPGLDDPVLAKRACAEGRWLLTRDRGLAAKGPRTMLIRADGLEDQLVEVFCRLALIPPVALARARCAACNGELLDVERSEISDVTPTHVVATAPRFRRCSGCARVYWSGSHGEKIVTRMKRVAARVASSQ